jgi:hypothetical protein
MYSPRASTSRKIAAAQINKTLARDHKTQIVRFVLIAPVSSRDVLETKAAIVGAFFLFYLD